MSWHGRYVGFVGAINGTHPEGMRFRPDSTAKYKGDNEGGDWLLFWEVDDLKEIPEPERQHIGEFVPYGKKKPYGNSFSLARPDARESAMSELTQSRPDSLGG